MIFYVIENISDGVDKVMARMFEYFWREHVGVSSFSIFKLVYCCLNLRCSIVCFWCVACKQKALIEELLRARVEFKQLLLVESLSTYVTYKQERVGLRSHVSKETASVRQHFSTNVALGI